MSGNKGSVEPHLAPNSKFFYFCVLRSIVRAVSLCVINYGELRGDDVLVGIRYLILFFFIKKTGKQLPPVRLTKEHPIDRKYVFCNQDSRDIRLHHMSGWYKS